MFKFKKTKDVDADDAFCAYFLLTLFGSALCFTKYVWRYFPEAVLLLGVVGLFFMFLEMERE